MWQVEKHESFEDRFCADIGKRVEGVVAYTPLTYHSVLTESERVRLSANNSIAATAIRTAADRLFDSPAGLFEVDFKTSNNPRYVTAAIELCPLLKHALETQSRFYAPCMYAFWHSANKTIGYRAWWSHETPKPARICIPTGEKMWAESVNWLLDRAESLWGYVPVETVTSHGSGDPYVVIAERDLLAMPRPSELVRDFVKNSGLTL